MGWWVGNKITVLLAVLLKPESLIMRLPAESVCQQQQWHNCICCVILYWGPYTIPYCDMLQGGPHYVPAALEAPSPKSPTLRSTSAPCAPRSSPLAPSYCRRPPPRRLHARLQNSRALGSSHCSSPGQPLFSGFPPIPPWPGSAL